MQSDRESVEIIQRINWECLFRYNTGGVQARCEVEVRGDEINLTFSHQNNHPMADGKLDRVYITTSRRGLSIFLEGLQEVLREMDEDGCEVTTTTVDPEEQQPPEPVVPRPPIPQFLDRPHLRPW